MTSRFGVLAFAFLFTASGIAAADVMAGIGAAGVIEDSSSFTEATAEFSASSTLFSSAESAVYAGISGTAKIDPSSSSGEFSGAADLFCSRLFGLNLAGVKIGLEGEHSDFTDEESLTGLLSFPVTFNGDSVSFSVIPQFEYAPLAGGHASAGAAAFLSFAVREVIVKPGASFSSVWYDDGARMYEVGPGFRTSWYPGFPLTTEMSATYRFLTDPEGAAVDPVLETGFRVGASPFDWLLLAGQVDLSLLEGTSATEVFLESSFFVFRSGIRALSVPLYLRYTPDGAARFEIGAGIRYFF